MWTPRPSLGDTWYGEQTRDTALACRPGHCLPWGLPLLPACRALACEHATHAAGNCLDTSPASGPPSQLLTRAHSSSVTSEQPHPGGAWSPRGPTGPPATRIPALRCEDVFYVKGGSSRGLGVWDPVRGQARIPHWPAEAGQGRGPFGLCERWHQPCGAGTLPVLCIPDAGYGGPGAGWPRCGAGVDVWHFVQAMARHRAPQRAVTLQQPARPGCP